MLKTTGVEPSVTDPVSVGENSIVDEVDDNNKIGRIKSQANFQVKLATFKKTIHPDFSAKSKLLAETSLRSVFFTPKARLAFTK